MSGKLAIGALPGSGTWLLFFAVTAVALAAKGQSCIVPRGAGMKEGTPFGAFASFFAA
jgi:hypothetical protein